MTDPTDWDADALARYLEFSRNEIAPGGVFSTRSLRDRRGPDRALAELADRGTVTRLRRGWYALNGADPAVRAAVCAGGVLTCVSALRFHGIWVPTDADARTHARAARGGVRLDAAVHQCSPRQRLAAPRQAVDPPLVALRVAAGCVGRDELVACIDSGLRRGLVNQADLSTAFHWAPGGAKRSVRRAGAADSGTETLVRLRLRAKRVRVRTQVHVPGVGWVDFVLGRVVVLEVDSRAHHTGEENYQRDRWRDLRLLAMGYVVVRVTWEQVTYHWEEAEGLILATLKLHAGRQPQSTSPAVEAIADEWLGSWPDLPDGCTWIEE